MIARHHIDIDMDRLADLCQRYHVCELALFGSVLRDDFRADSDIDVLVEFEPHAHVTFFTLARLQRELAALLQRDVDVVLKRGLNPLIRESVLNSTEVVYAV